MGGPKFFLISYCIIDPILVIIRKRKSLSASLSSALNTLDEEKEPLTTGGAEKLIEDEETMTGNVSPSLLPHASIAC